MNIFCRVEDCRWFEGGFCKRGNISISEDCECEDYKSYLDTEEWRKPFWKRMLDKDSNNCICRVRYYGKEIEINGRKFFAETKSEYAYLTDELTGMGSGTIEFIKNNFDKVLEAASKVDVPLLELPIAIYDENSRIYTYEKDVKEGAE